jgi:16S rRNA processing protein RimM
MWVEFGHVTAVSGLQGEVKVFLLNPESTWLRTWRTVAMLDAHGARRMARLKVRTGAGKRWLARIEGVESREDAESLIGVRFEVDRTELPEVPEGEYYLSDVIGLEVRSGERVLGKVVAVHTTGPVEILEIQAGDETRYIPSLKTHIHRVDVVSGIVELTRGYGEE